MNTKQKTELIESAIAAQRFAYAPYSKYLVGAALLSDSGETFTGCNVENASYGLTICAERTAMVKAVSEGETSFQAIAIATPDGATPCGACRQFLVEFCSPEMTIIVYGTRTKSEAEFTLGQLLPDAFGH